MPNHSIFFLIFLFVSANGGVVETYLGISGWEWTNKPKHNSPEKGENFGAIPQQQKTHTDVNLYLKLNLKFCLTAITTVNLVENQEPKHSPTDGYTCNDCSSFLLKQRHGKKSASYSLGSKNPHTIHITECLIMCLSALDNLTYNNNAEMHENVGISFLRKEVRRNNLWDIRYLLFACLGHSPWARLGGSERSSS